MVNINEMSIFRQDREPTGTHRSGGVACYVHEKYASYTTKVDELSVTQKHIETVTLKTTSPTSRHRLVVSVYRPPKGNVEKFYKKLSKLIETSGFVNKDIWIMGDMNVDFKHRNSAKYKKTLAFLKRHHFRQLRTGITRLHPKGSTIIDHIYTNVHQDVTSGSLNEYISDHIPILAIYKKERAQHTRKKVTGRSYKDYDKEKYSTYTAIG